MEITAERTSMVQKGLPSSHSTTPLIPTHHFRSEVLSFTEILLSNVEEWSKPSTPLPPPPPPIAFSGSDRFIKGRLPHRTLAISASLSSLFDEAMLTLSDICKHGDVRADNGIVKTQMMTHEEMHGGDDRTCAADSHVKLSIDTDNVQNPEVTMQVLSSNGMVDVLACSTDNRSEVNATSLQDCCLLSANDTADVATCDTCEQMQDTSQNVHCSDDAMLQNPSEDDGRVQSLDKFENIDCSLSTSKKLQESVHVSDKVLSELHMENDRGGEVVIKSLLDVVLEHSLPSECESSLPSPILRCDVVDAVTELPLPSLLTSPNDNNLTGSMGGAPQPFPTNDNNLANSPPSISKCPDEINKGITNVESELFPPSYIERRDDDRVGVNADVVTDLPLPSTVDSVNIVAQATEGLSQLSLPSLRKSNNTDNIRGIVEGIAELQSQPLLNGHVVNGLQSTVIKEPILLQQNEQVQALEEGELSEHLSGDQCLEMQEDVMAVGEGGSHLLNENLVESKGVVSSTDDEMDQPISLFISRYRTQSSARKMPPVETDSNIKTKVERGNKRMVEEQEQVLKEVISRDMAVEAHLKQTKWGQKRPSRVARVSDNNKGGGLVGGASKVSIVSMFGMGEAKDDAENQHVELMAAQGRRDQEGSMILHLRDTGFDKDP